MAKDCFELEGTVEESLKGAKFKVRIDDNNLIVTCTLGGKLRMNNIHILEGDRVTVEISAADVTKGRIIWRNK